jgi:uncharacterized protein (DUF2249 family)
MSHDTSFLSIEKLSIQSRHKVDVTRHPKFPLAFGELASGGFPHCISKMEYHWLVRHLQTECLMSISKMEYPVD